MRGVNGIAGMSVFALNLIIGLGLGLAIDYSLFVVSRFREELARGAPTADALSATLRTAGRTVIFSAATVAAALASLLVFPQRFLYSMGVGGVLVTVVAAVGLAGVPARAARRARAAGERAVAQALAPCRASATPPPSRRASGTGTRAG